MTVTDWVICLLVALVVKWSADIAARKVRKG